MVAFNGRRKKGRSLSHRKHSGWAYNHATLYASAKKSYASGHSSHKRPRPNCTKSFKPLIKSTPVPLRNKRKIHSATKAKTPFKSPVNKKPKTLSPRAKLILPLLSPISTLGTQKRTPRKSKRTLNYKDNAYQDENDNHPNKQNPWTSGLSMTGGESAVRTQRK